MQLPPNYPQVGQPSELLIHSLLERPLRWSPKETIHYRNNVSITYLELAQRIQRLGALLASLGVQRGDRIGVMDWDSHRYLECFFAIPMAGAVLHTINPRLSLEQILYTIRHASDRVLLIHSDFVPLLEKELPHLPSVQAVIVLADETAATGPDGFPCIGHYEALLSQQPPGFEFPTFPEETVATLFYTTGTTGDPKGVFFTHRQLVLHTLSVGLALSSMRDPVSIQAGDVYMPLTPMFHAHAWGIPYLATLLGLRQVFIGRFEVGVVLQLLREHRVTFSHCVPTVLQMVLHHPEAANTDFSHWKVMTGGSALSTGLAHRAADRGIRLVASYGMSETCPVMSIAHIKPEEAQSPDARRVDILTRTGFPLPLAQAAIVDPDDRPLPTGSDAIGELVLRSPWNTYGYYRDEERSRQLWRSGWLHTGDVAYLDSDGYIHITDRLKDVIKTGGEWISSLELENTLSQHPSIHEVAVVARPDGKWGERPHAEVVLREEFRDRTSPSDLQAFIRKFVDQGSLPRHALLTAIRFAEAIPRTSVGKINKRLLRESLASNDSGKESNVTP